jgi:hypothetical protein
MAPEQALDSHEPESAGLDHEARLGMPASAGGEAARAVAGACGVRGGRRVEPEAVLALQRTAGNRAVQRMLQRREVADVTQQSGPKDWTTFDREHNTKYWQNACLLNLNALDTGQYRRIEERRDFYKWFYEYTVGLGYTTRWPLAAFVVANGAHLIADMDRHHETANDMFGMANVQLQGMMREGNQVIFEDVFPKLKKLLDGGPISGRRAFEWDMQALAEEQTLIQPLYSRMSKETRDQLEYIARQNFLAAVGDWLTSESHVARGPYNNPGDVPAFNGRDLQSITDRWKYGMWLGDIFAKGGTGFDASRDLIPTVSADYSSGAAFRRLDTHAALHQLDAWLNPNRLSRTGSGSDLDAIIRALTDLEKREVLADTPADGGKYSIWFAQFSFITEAQVRAALPADPTSATDVNLFVQRFKAERRRVEQAYPDPSYAFPM